MATVNEMNERAGVMVLLAVSQSRTSPPQREGGDAVSPKCPSEQLISEGGLLLQILDSQRQACWDIETRVDRLSSSASCSATIGRYLLYTLYTVFFARVEPPYVQEVHRSVCAVLF